MLSIYVRKVAILICLFQAVYLLLWYLAMSNSQTEELKRNTSNYMEVCPLIPPDLEGDVQVNKRELDWMDIENKYNKVINGSHRPKNCTARHKVAILVPFRDRETHLKIFINHMHGFLMRQQLEYGIYVVELDKGIPFNRGFLFNVGFMEALKDNNYGCFVFHDVDLLPLNDFNLYQCPDQPRHLSVAIDKYKFKLLYPTNFGGVSSISTEQFTMINGYSNLFFGWGGEDDDFYNRVVMNKMSITRVINRIARYTMLPHQQAVANPLRSAVLDTGNKRVSQDADGLNTLRYNITGKKYKKLYVHIKVTLDKRDAVQQLMNRLREKSTFKKKKSEMTMSKIFDTFSQLQN